MYTSSTTGAEINNPQKLHSISQLDWVYDKFDDVIDMLDDRSLKEMSGGYSSDVDKLLGKLKNNVVSTFSGVPEEVTSSQFYSLSHLTSNIHESLKIINYNYFKLTMIPDFYVSEHSGEWGNIVQLYPRTCLLASRRLGKTFEFSMALPIWKLYGYRAPTLLNPIDRQTKLRRQGLIITNKFELGKKILSDISKEIKNNNALHERLRPENKNEGSLGKEYIETRNGGEIHLRSATSSSRGLHPGWVVVDDYGDNNWIYSKPQRDKAIDFFYGDIMKTLERGSTMNVVGTPFHENDIYAHIRDNDPTFKYFEYPAVMPDGEVVAPHRWNMTELEEEYQTNGPLIFSREILVVPVSDSSTIFPWEMLKKAFVNMQDYRLVQNRDSFPIKFKFVSVGCDFARSANIGADATVFSVFGIDDLENYWLLYTWRKKGADHNEQIAKLKEIERNFRPDEIVGESNGFQQVMLDIGREHGIKNITDFNTTGWNKKDLYEGLPSLAILFNNGKIRFPRGDVHSKETTDWLCSEFNSITIKPESGKLESAGEHDDGPMSVWFAIKCLSVNKNRSINFVMV